MSLIVATQTDMTKDRVTMTIELVDKLMLSENVLKMIQINLLITVTLPTRTLQ